MNGFAEDLRHAFRRLAANPGATSAALIALALGIGFSTATYSTSDALLFRPLLIPEIGRVVLIAGKEESGPRNFRAISPADYAEWKTSAHSIESIALTRIEDASLTGAGDPVQVSLAKITASFFDVMRQPPILGRAFLPEEEVPGKDRTAILGYYLWESQFGADPGVVGREITLDGRAFTVVGVMPKDFRFPNVAQLWIPLALPPAEWSNSGNFYLRTVARLAPGVSLEEARAEFEALAKRFSAQWPDTHKGLTADVQLLRERISGELTASYSRLMLAAVLFLLLIACLNVAGLQFAQVLTRTREMAIRSALGAPRLRILRQVLTESVVVAFAGAALGIVVALWCFDASRANMPPEVERFLPGWRRIGLNGWVVFWTALTAATAGIISGLGPALWLSRSPLASGLRDSGRASTGGVGRQRMLSFLVVAETAMALVLLVGAALMIKGFRAIGTLPVATDPARVLTFRVALPDSRYGDQDRRLAMEREMLRRLSELPRVRSVALIMNMPYSGSSNASLVTVEGRPVERGPKSVAQFQIASADYFRTVGIRIVRGRALNDSDSASSQPVAVVSETFVRRFYPNEDPIGRRFQLMGGGWLTVAGVAADVVHDFSERAPYPVAYLPYQQVPPRAFHVALETGGGPLLLVPAVREIVRSLDPALPVFDVRTFQKLISDARLGIGYITVTLGITGLVALFLAVLGAYSLMARSVGERTREIGVRLALGATRADVLRLILRRGLLIGAAGITLGLAGSLAVARLFAGLLFGVSASDTTTFVGVPAALACAVAFACLIPARRVTRTDPVASLRYE